MRRLLTFSLAGLVAQLVDGSLGMGYGVTSTSFLVTSGTAAALASASVHLAEVGTSLVSGVAHHRFGNVDWRALRWMAVPGAFGAFLGATVLSSLSADTAKPWVAVVLAVLGVYVLVRSRSGRSVGEVVANRPHGKRFFAALGAGAGFLDAAGGGGWGPVGTSTLLAAGRMEARRVIGTVSASEFLVSLGASVGFLIALPWKQIDPVLVGALLLGGSVAAPFAAWLTQRLDQRTLGTAIGGFIVATNARTLAGVLGVRPSILAAASVLLAAGWAVLALRLAVAARRAPLPVHDAVG
ncbi:MAG TPA: sulfite exporter TauE/SafE family protein [Acidimicrobiales bacterium]|nr:sulfite exporter TauE/SafE family protein [Acidimicrobiales bacterium]